MGGECRQAGPDEQGGHDVIADATGRIRWGEIIFDGALIGVYLQGSIQHGHHSHVSMYSRAAERPWQCVGTNFLEVITDVYTDGSLYRRIYMDSSLLVPGRVECVY